MRFPHPFRLLCVENVCSNNGTPITSILSLLSPLYSGNNNFAPNNRRSLPMASDDYTTPMATHTPCNCTFAHDWKVSSRRIVLHRPPAARESVRVCANFARIKQQIANGFARIEQQIAKRPMHFAQQWNLCLRPAAGRQRSKQNIFSSKSENRHRQSRCKLLFHKHKEL